MFKTNQKMVGLFSAILLAAMLLTASSIQVFADPVKIEWAANPAAEQVQTYDMQLSVAGGSFITYTNTPGTNVTIELAQGSQYAVRIIAKNLSGDSIPSDEGSTGPVPSKPGTPIVTVNP